MPDADSCRNSSPYTCLCNHFVLYLERPSLDPSIHPPTPAPPPSAYTPVTPTQTKSHSICLLTRVFLSKNDLTWNFKQTQIIDNNNCVYFLIILRITDGNKVLHCIKIVRFSLSLSLSLSLSRILSSTQAMYEGIFLTT